jgi:hypothetical protein
VGVGFDGPILCRFNLRAAGWVTGHVSFWAGLFRAKKFRGLDQNGLSLFHLSFSFSIFHLSFCFSIFRESRIISKIAQN